MWRCADPPRTLSAAGILWLALFAPPLCSGLESSMVLHMLLQLPLLAAIGYWVGESWMRHPARGPAARVLAGVQSFNGGGLTGLLIASFVMIVWMLPRLLDLARLDPAIDAVKFMSVPAAGLALALSWPRCPAIARGVVHIEVIATLLRFGWGYLAADSRLCLVYLIEDQRQVGAGLLVLAAAYAFAVVRRPMFGTGTRTPGGAPESTVP